MIIRKCLSSHSCNFTDHLPSTSPLCFTKVVPIHNQIDAFPTFCFLNKNLSIGEDKIDWLPGSVSRLWRYNLHYFDYLRDASQGNECKDQLINSWIESNPYPLKPAWEPYPASLRIVNWTMFFSERSPDDIPDSWNKSLYNQLLWLEKNLELHILANHYFENIKALYFGGNYFKGEEASRWLKYSEAELAVQLNDQFLEDGAHYERSPQYHCRMLENCLDIYNLIKNNTIGSKLHVLLRDIIQNGLEFLQSISYPDKTIPLFNDSALATSVYPQSIFDYADRLGFSLVRDSGQLINNHESGLYGYKNEQDMFLIDCGDIGPAYQPGHTHCDFLSYELMVDGKKLIVDSGVYEYQKGGMRDYVRSTRAHNTISVNRDEQSEIWGEFRVARRAKKLFAEINKSDEHIEFNGAFKGFYQNKGKVEHNRKVRLGIENSDKTIRELDIYDRLSGIEGEQSAVSYIHIHPDFNLEDKGSGEIAILLNEACFATLFIDNFEYAIVKSFYCPEFGLKYENSCIEITKQEKMPFEMHYRIVIH